MQETNLRMITEILSGLAGYSNDVIEASVIEYISKKTTIDFSYEGDLIRYQGMASEKLMMQFEKKGFPVSIEFVIEFFEALLEKEKIIENGIVFTPKYIAEFIFEQATSSYDFNRLPRIIDPGCGCGIFLVASAVKLHEYGNWSFQEIFSNAIYGIELNEDNARRCKIVLNLVLLMNNESNKGLQVNILCSDSLRNNWTEMFGVDGFNFIFGNPPYVNTHDMSKETAKFLKETFSTTKTGVYNIFYAFIEHAMNFLLADGLLSYIIPNNFLTIKSASELRKFIIERRSLRMIIDFSNNMVFKPVRTYNCIIQLTTKKNEEFFYSVLDEYEDIELGLNNISFNTMPLDKLDVNGWKLVDKKTMANIQKIEGQFRNIKAFIRTGIATLRDDVYIVEKDDEGYFKDLSGVRYNLEKDLIKRLYKIPELKASNNIQDICRHIIFPYKKSNTGFEIIPEDELQKRYPQTYAYLLERREELDSRDKGKINPVAWYAYGRTQGLNKYGKKLLFPTFASHPRFSFVNDEFALFCNGYAVFENDYIELDLLARILNSTLMQYYVSNTSYAIEGGYYCYQKKYIERFSLPLFTELEKREMQKLSDQELDAYLLKKYQLDV